MKISYNLVKKESNTDARLGILSILRQDMEH